MQMPALKYEANTFDDDLTDCFKNKNGFKYTKKSLIIIMRSRIATFVNQTLASTVRDWIQEKAHCSAVTIDYTELDWFLSFAFLKHS